MSRKAAARNTMRRLVVIFAKFNLWKQNERKIKTLPDQVGEGFGVPEPIRTADLPLRSMACRFVRCSSNNFLSHEIRACVMMYMTKMTQNTQNTALLRVFRGVQLANS